MDRQWAKEAVIRVGDGRGFIVENTYNERFVITAGHCLPRIPEADPTLGRQPFEQLLAALNEEPFICTECLFVDPIADIAVLGPAEDHAFSELTHSPDPFRVGPGEFCDFWHHPNPQECRGWLLSLKGDWFPCVVRRRSEMLELSEAAKPIVGGMSGSPILTDDGTAIGVLSMSRGIGNEDHTESDSNPRLFYHLPAGFLRQLAEHDSAVRQGISSPDAL